MQNKFYLSFYTHTHTYMLLNLPTVDGGQASKTT